MRYIGSKSFWNDTRIKKSCLLYSSYFDIENDISVAVCGSNISNYQINLLTKLGVEEVIIAFDKQFKIKGDLEFNRWTKKLTDIDKKYRKYVKISFMFDKNDILQYKSSPIDEGKDKFIKLYEERFSLWFMIKNKLNIEKHIKDANFVNIIIIVRFLLD